MFQKYLAKKIEKKTFLRLKESAWERRLFCKFFRNLKNGGSDQVKTELRPMGVPKNLPNENFKNLLKHIFESEELVQSN